MSDRLGCLLFAALLTYVLVRGRHAKAPRTDAGLCERGRDRVRAAVRNWRMN